MLDAFLNPPAAGAQYSLAETCSTSFAQRLVVLLPHYRNIDVWGLLSEHKLERWGGHGVGAGEQDLLWGGSSWGCGQGKEQGV